MSRSTLPPTDIGLTPSRIRLARQRRGLSKVALASALRVTTRTVGKYETEGAPAARASDIAAALDLPAEFFSRPEREAISPEQGFFRARRRVTATQLHSARATASMGIEMYEWLAERFALPAMVMPDLDDHSPADAAAALRSLWGRSSGPLPNLVQLSEAHGVRVLSLPVDTAAVDAFSLWQNDVPYAFLSMAKTAERSRFDLAHELGHLVMHSRVGVGAGGATDREIEREADAFASAFLMPRNELLAYSSREPAVPEVLRLRTHFKVSAMAMTYSLRTAGRLTEWGYRQNCAHLAQQGFRAGEPGGMERERSRVFATVFPMLRAQGVGVSEVCRELGLTPSELHGLTMGQVAATVTAPAEPKRGAPATHPDETRRSRPTLRVVR